ncbi:hypothetical protein EXIGLDRAFT_610717 [Exidia glandulosa HHB12029]|uniref:Tc1-like transposase DDE domain-containing protein n=1 Tax=Exidia glandulosa HHB12029 TaxID=1314781 RepID=A0A165JUH6_EXIGL|nr:hypothetical protein EXIGLDRAFT_610717 [Exidia glandulosa HHB12029]
MERGLYCARVLRQMVRAFIADRTVLPINPYGDWKTSMLSDQDLGNALMLHLQELGDSFTSSAIVDWLARPEVKAEYGISKTISESTARRWLLALGYRYRLEARGQYVDGHERKDVVWYRQKIYIPGIQELLQRTMEYDLNGAEVHPRPREFYTSRQVVIWYHDESIFYAHDRRRKRWFHKDASPKPYQKGEGASLMVADFVSAEFGWLRSPDQKSSARCIFRPGANRDGYFTNIEIRNQATEAAELVKKHYPRFDHVFVYDNATTHRKRADDALSARHMPKLPSESLAKNWLVERSVIHPATGRPERLPNNKIRKERIRMADTKNPVTGEPQSLYFPDDHPTKPGLFKGMSQILVERGWDAAPLARGVKRAECPSFKCADVTDPSATCCVRRILFNQPDFTNVPSLLETDMEPYGIRILFLPKFHCELNPIEQCWGYAKRVYRLNPASSREEVLEENTLKALEAVPLVSIRRFFNRAHRFVDAYSQGLNGQQSAWACKKYRGHRCIPEWILEDLEKAGLKK